MSLERTLGWDLGGAHVKAAQLDSQRRVRAVIQAPCPLWQGVEWLDKGIDEVLRALGGTTRRHVVTMTGELSDRFADRHIGVKALIGVMRDRFPRDEIRVYGGNAGFLDPDSALEAPDRVASANWLASASVAARQLHEGLLLDVGSTTSDLVPFRAGEVLALGRDDHERLVEEELVYCGVVRTPVMALTRRVPFRGRWVPLMAEHFATSADVYRLTGELPPRADMLPSADRGEKTLGGSARRLARMLGLDAGAADPEDWRRAAEFIAERQLRGLLDAGDRILSRDALSAEAPLVGAGVGGFLVRKLASRMGRGFLAFDDLISCADDARAGVSDCAPAAAVAWLGAAPELWA